MWREHHNQQASHFFVLTLHKKALFLERTPKKLRGNQKSGREASEASKNSMERSRSFKVIEECISITMTSRS
jgi:hypothetical protein